MELLIVIAIIGILASIVLVSLSSARTKAKDAAIISAANSMMKMAQTDSIATGEYGDYYGYVWGGSTDVTQQEAVCESYWGKTSNPQGMRSACKSIVRNVGGVTNLVTWQSTWRSGWCPTCVKLSIMTYLPGKQVFYCIGSDGQNSMSTTGSWSEPGCAGSTSTE